jgi:hypothetical protein
MSNFSPYVTQEEYAKLLANYNEFSAGNIETTNLMNDSIKYLTDTLLVQDNKIRSMNRILKLVSIFSIFQFSLIIFLYIFK